MIKAALTGIMGSGKSTAAQAMEALDIPVYYSDHRAKEMYALPEVIKEIIGILGEGVVDSKGRISLKKMGQMIFQDDQKLQKVNEAIHPRVMHDFRIWAQQQEKPLVVFESALVFEAGLQQMFDCVIAVSTPEEIAVKRLAKRDKWPPEQVKQRMKHQWSNREKVEKAHYVIENHNDNMILPQLLTIIREIKRDAAEN